MQELVKIGNKKSNWKMKKENKIIMSLYLNKKDGNIISIFTKKNFYSFRNFLNIIENLTETFFLKEVKIYEFLQEKKMSITKIFEEAKKNKIKFVYVGNKYTVIINDIVEKRLDKKGIIGKKENKKNILVETFNNNNNTDFVKFDNRKQYFYEINKENSFNTYFLSKKYGSTGCKDILGKQEKPELFEKLKLEEIQKIYGFSKFGEVVNIQEINKETGEKKQIYKRQLITPIVATADNGCINKNCYK